MSILGEIPYETFKIILVNCDTICLGNLRGVNRAAASNQQLIHVISENSPAQYFVTNDASLKVYGQYIEPIRIINIYGLQALERYLEYYADRITAEEWSLITSYKDLSQGEIVYNWGDYLDWDIMAAKHDYVDDESIIKYYANHLNTTHLLSLRYEGKSLRVLFQQINWKEYFSKMTSISNYHSLVYVRDLLDWNLFCEIVPLTVITSPFVRKFHKYIDPKIISRRTMTFCELRSVECILDVDEWFESDAMITDYDSYRLDIAPIFYCASEYTYEEIHMMWDQKMKRLGGI